MSETERVLTERKLASLRQLAEETTAALSRFSQAAIDRELRVAELKREVNALLERAGESPRYPPAEGGGAGAAAPANPAAAAPETAEQRQAARKLTEDAVRARDVAEKLNRELRAEIAERVLIEEALLDSRGRLARELADTRILQRTGSLLIQDERGEGLNESILDAAMAILGADSSSIQVADADGAELRLLAWRNLHPRSVESWRRVPVGAGTCCGMALRRGERIVVPDVESEAALQGTQSLEDYRLSGIKAVQSTPLLTRGGRLVGMMSTHWHRRHRADERALAYFDVLARQMADLLERRQALHIVRSSELWLAGQNEAFQKVLDGAPLEESLAVLVRTAVDYLMGADRRRAYQQAGHTGNGLIYVAGLSQATGEAPEGYEFGPASLACGLAFSIDAPAALPELDDAALGEPWRWLAEQREYLGRWFFPIETSAGRVIGTAAFFFDFPREATPRDLELAAVLTRAAAIIISRGQEAEERAGAERARQESEEKYRTLFNSIDEGLGIVEVVRDPSGPVVDAFFVDVNEVFERLTGMARLQGRRLGDSDLRVEAGWLAALGEVARSGVPQRIENFHQDLGRWYRVYASRVGEKGSLQVGIVLEDISERKNRERHQALLAAIADELVGLEKVGETMERLGERIAWHFEASWCLFAEVGADLPNGANVYVWNDPQVAAPNGSALLRDLLAGDGPEAHPRGEPLVVGDTRRADSAGAGGPAELGMRSFLVVPLMQDQVCRFVLAVIDGKPRDWRGDEIELARELTHRLCTRLERARAEGALRHSEERLRTLADSVPQLIWTNRGDGAADYFNRRWYEYTGLSFEQCSGLGWEACVHPEDAAGARQEWARTLAAGEIFACELRLRRADGNYRWFIGRNVPMKDAEGRIAGWFGSATDIHDLKLAQAELQEADRRKNHFLAMLGRELRNPLAAIRNGVKLLRSEKARPESRAAALPVVADQVGHMERLVDDLLDLTRVVQGSVQVDRQPMALQEALHQALEMVRLQAEPGGFQFGVDLPAEPLEILGDRVRLTQVFINVLNNAVKYSDHSRLIEVAATREDGEAVVRVRDYGRGISPELLPRIFEPFVQATPGLTLQAGLGLGLAVVRQLVRLHDGDVEISSQGARKGSEVVLRLPLSPSTP